MFARPRSFMPSNLYTTLIVDFLRISRLKCGESMAKGIRTQRSRPLSDPGRCPVVSLWLDILVNISSHFASLVVRGTSIPEYCYITVLERLSSLVLHSPQLLEFKDSNEHHDYPRGGGHHHMRWWQRRLRTRRPSSQPRPQPLGSLD